MSLNKPLLSELQHEAASTRKILARVPTELFSWQPHEKSMGFERLAKHIADLFGWPALILGADELDFANRPYPPVAANSTEELLATLDENLKKSLAALENATDENLNKKWTMRRGETIIRELPKWMAIRFTVLNHMVHHRGQLSVYLRLNNIPVPGIYGPSADEQAAVTA